jgi:hypothetical protein
MNVFTEWHHGGLFHSMQMLFEGRLGMKLYGPVGTQWYSEGFWNYSNNPAVIKQYLDPLDCDMQGDGQLYHFDPSEGICQRRVPFEMFKQMKFDIILCTLQEHQRIYRRLRDLYQPQAKLIQLSGNQGERIDFSIVDNFIDTTNGYDVPSGINTVKMHQEFPLLPFHYEPPANHKTIKNFMNCLHESRFYPIWQMLKKDLPDYYFGMHGGQGDNGNISGLDKLGDAMRGSSFIFQLKAEGEGFGHVIHNAYACGRPVIVAADFYKGKTAECLLEDNVSAIFVDNKSWEAVLEQIRFWSDPIRHAEMCANARKKFEQYVNFDEDEQKFRVFMERLK